MVTKERIDCVLYSLAGCTLDELDSLSPHQLRVFEDEVRTSRSGHTEGVSPAVQGRGNPLVVSKRGITSSACTSEYEQYASIG